MKKVLALLTLCSILQLNALELNIDIGTGMSYAKSSGKPIFTKDLWSNSSSDFNHNSAPGIYTWINIESNEKYWPKAYFEFRQLKTEGHSYINLETDSTTINSAKNFVENIIGKKISDIELDSRLTQTSMEGYLYYEYFEESDFITLQAGLGMKKFDVDYVVTLMEGVQLNSNGGDTIPLVMLNSTYLLHKKDNGSSVVCELGGKMYIFGDSDVYDYLGKVTFMTRYSDDTNIGLEIGYKKIYIDIKGSDIDTIAGYMSSSGVYIGLTAHFK